MAKFDEAKVLYKTLCQALDSLNWKYNKEEHEDFFMVFTSASGKDANMRLAIRIEVDRELMYLKSPMPFAVPENMRDTMGLAIVRANWSMLNGSFEMDNSDGFVAFKMVVPFMQSMVSAEVCRYMILLSCNMIDKFSGKLAEIAEGKLGVTEFQQFIDNY